MCSRFAESASGERRFATTFSASALPEMPRSELAQLGQLPEKFVMYVTDGYLHAVNKQGALPEKLVGYVTDGFLHSSNRQGKCGSCWAFALAQALRIATDVAYRSLGRFFVPRYFSVQYMLSCYEVPDAMCGCVGGDLARAFDEVSRRGTVLEKNFPYDNNARPELGILERDSVCAQSPATLDTCPPCKPGQAPTRVADRVVDCVPCEAAAAPFFFPGEPFRVAPSKDELHDRVAAVKRELLRTGPVCCTIGVNAEALRAAGEPPRLVKDVTDAPTYAPDFVSASALKHAVIIVGYYDPPGQTPSSVWICRNSWGDEWGYRVRANRVRPEAGRIVVSQTELGGFFNVSMYERQTELGLLDGAVSFKEVRTRAAGDAAPRALRYSDAETLPLPKLALAVPPPSGPSIGVEDQPWRFPWLALLAALALLLTYASSLWSR